MRDIVAQRTRTSGDPGALLGPLGRGEDTAHQMTIRQRATGWLGIVGPLGLGFLVAVALAYQAYDARREHRNAAAKTIQDHADFAAYLLADIVDQRMSLAMLYAFYEEDRVNSADPPRAAGTGILRQENELARCEAVIPRDERFFFRYSFDDDTLVEDRTIPRDIRAWLTTELPRRGPETTDRAYAHLVHRDMGKPDVVVVYKIRKLDTADLTFAYGFNSCFRDHEGNVFEMAQRASGVFPPALVGTDPPDSLYTLSVLSANHTVLHGDDSVTPIDGFVGTAALTPSDAYDGMQLRLALRPSAAVRLVAGGFPASRLPLALALVILTAGLMTLAVLQLRREQEVIQIRERFVGNVSHELRTPLQQILLYADLLRLNRVHTDEERGRALQVIDQETRRLIGLVENVLQLSRLSNGDAGLQCGPLDLTEMTERTVSVFRPLADEETVGITLQTRDSPVVTAEPNAVRQVLLNILDNAVKYGPAGQSILVEVFRENGFGCISVHDEGPGVPMADRERIWESFYRLEREEREAIAGSGIGLAIVRQLVEEMAGTVTVTDGANGGALFTVKLPCVEDASHGSDP